MKRFLTPLLVVIVALTGCVAVPYDSYSTYQSAPVVTGSVVTGYYSSSYPHGYYSHEPVYTRPAPAYVTPAPVYVRPAPYHAAPAPVYVKPAPVLVGPSIHFGHHRQRPGHRGAEHGRAHHDRRHHGDHFRQH